LTTPQDLVSKRPYIIVGAFVFGMLLTPPDVISQTLLALPMWVLFEVGILLSRFYAPRDRDAESEGEAQTDDDFEPMDEAAMDAELERIAREEARLADELDTLGDDGTRGDGRDPPLPDDENPRGT
jgi:sec-independent protein translocase protein TatC